MKAFRKRILVTGGAGFLGSHLCERLLGRGFDVLCVDNYFTGARDNIVHLLDNPYFEVMRHDVTFPLYVEVDEIYNLACPASPIHYQHDPVQTTKTSVVGNANSTVLVSSFNMIVFVMLLLTMSNLVMFIKDKTHMTTQRILLAARSKLDYYVQLVALFATLAVFEFGVMLAAMTWIFHVPLGLSPLRIGLLVSAFALFNVFAIGLGLLLVSRTTQESVGRLMITAVTLPMAMLGGALWPLSIMPGWMQTASRPSRSGTRRSNIGMGPVSR